MKERTGKNNKIKKITIEPQTVYQRTYYTITIADKTELLRNTALEAIRKYGTDTTRRMYFTEYNLKALEKISYSVAIPPESKGEFVKQIPRLQALSFVHHGAYEDIPNIRKNL